MFVVPNENRRSCRGRIGGSLANRHRQLLVHFTPFHDTAWVVHPFSSAPLKSSTARPVLASWRTQAPRSLESSGYDDGSIAAAFSATGPTIVEKAPFRHRRHR